MKYPAVECPYHFSSLDEVNSMDDLKAYAQWFIDALPKRMAILTTHVQATQGYEKWHPDFSKESLRSLGTWFLKQIQLLQAYPKTAEEIEHNLGNWFFRNFSEEMNGTAPEVIFEAFKSWYRQQLSIKQSAQPADLAMQWYDANLAPENNQESADLAAFRNEWYAIVHSTTLDPLCFSYSMLAFATAASSLYFRGYCSSFSGRGFIIHLKLLKLPKSCYGVQMGLYLVPYMPF